MVEEHKGNEYLTIIHDKFDIGKLSKLESSETLDWVRSGNDLPPKGLEALDAFQYTGRGGVGKSRLWDLSRIDKSPALPRPL